MHLCVFEDGIYKNLFPLAHFRPVYDLKCGITTLREKIVRAYPGEKVTLHVRSYLADVVREKNPDILVNEIPDTAGQVLFINGRLLVSAETAKAVGKKYPGTDVVLTSGNGVAAAWISGQNLDRLKGALKEQVIEPGFFGSMDRRELSGAEFIAYPWQLVQHNGTQLVSDFEIITDGNPGVLGKVYEGAHLLNLSRIHIEEGAVVKPGVVLDAEEGPIYISRDAKIMPNAVIVGPAFIGEKSIVKIGAKIYENTTIGEVCKVGGEIEESIVHAYSNKQHEGFIGHAYLGEWVNIGADSNNSDLKNDYGNVKVYNNGSLVDTGSQFVGLTMGDHSKCGINSMFNTGTVVGVCCNIFGAGIPPNHVPSFSWGGASNGFVTYRIDKVVDVVRKVMARRKISLSDANERFLRTVFELTKEERKAAGVRDSAG